jgi:hypothetical protein
MGLLNPDGPIGESGWGMIYANWRMCDEIWLFLRRLGPCVKLWARGIA